MTKYSQKLIELVEYYRCKPCEDVPQDEDFCFFYNRREIYFAIPKRLQSWDDANNYLRIAGISDRLP
jgi:hypothetical protein